MSLSCSCNEDYDFAWYYWPANDFTTLMTSKRKRCKSCNKLIDIENICLEFKRFRYPKNEIEERIYGCDDIEIPLASFYHCEDCGEQYLNLSELKFCVNIADNMFDLLKEYQETYIK